MKGALFILVTIILEASTSFYKFGLQTKNKLHNLFIIIFIFPFNPNIKEYLILK